LKILEYLAFKKTVGKMWKNKVIVIIHPFTNEEILNPSIGGTRLIYEIKNYFEEKECKMKIISLSDFGSLTSTLHALTSMIRKSRRKDGILKNEKRRWLFNLIYALITELVSKLDILYRNKIKITLEQIKPSIIIYNYPYFGFSNVADISKSLSIPIIIYEHNVEWHFFEDKLGSGIVSKFLIHMAKKLELSNLRRADYIFCVNKRDYEVLVKEGKIDPTRLKIWIPFYQRSIKVNLSNIPENLKKKLKGKFVVGFVGTNFEPNIIAVENIIRIVREVPENVIFLIIGSVSKAFENRMNISPNVIFTGYVDDLDAYLALCDVFINPKTTSDTGMEIKMFDYLKFNKSIISTEMGARGFEDFKNVVIVPIEKMAEVIKKLYKCSDHDTK